MKLLALETSSRVGSVALFDGGQIVESSSFEHGLQNAARMLPLIDDLLRRRGWTPRDVTAIAVSIGPGSFTGLRIGTTFAKTFCFATGAACVAVPSLQVLAHNAPPGHRWVMPVLDARRGQVFSALYERVEGRLMERAAARLSPFAEALAAAPRPLMLLGDGAPLHWPTIAPEARTGVIELDAAFSTPTALVLGRLALEKLEQGEVLDPFKLAPLYLRKPEAQERMEAGLLKHLQ